MSLNAAILVFTFAINSVLGLLVLLRNYRDRANASFFLLSVFIALWSITNYLTDNTSTLEMNLIFARLANFTAFQAVFWIMYFSLNFPKPRKGKWYSKFLTWGYFIAGTVLPFMPQAIVDITANTGVAQQQLGILYPPFIVVIFLAFGRAIYSLANHYRLAESRLDALRIRYVIYGFTTSFVLGITANAILPALTGNWEVSRFGPVFTTFLVGAMTISIVRHRLFDIRLVVARSIAYLLLLFTLAVVYGLSIFTVSAYLFKNSAISEVEQLIYIVLAVFLAFTFQPLRRFFEKLTDKVFYRDRYDTQTILNELGTLLAAQLDLDVIARQTLRIIGQALRADGARLVILNGGETYKDTTYLKAPALPAIDALHGLHRSVVVADELAEGHLLSVLQTNHISTVVRLKTQQDVVGYLLFGSKQNGSIYTDQDVSLLEIISNELAVALQNARSYEQIAEFNITLQQRINEATHRLSQQNKMLKELDEAKDEFISMASHQLRTPLTTIKGYLSMLSEGDAGKVSAKQLGFVDLAFTSAERMVSLIADMLNVSRINTGKFVIEKTNFDLSRMVGEEVQQLQRYAKAKNVKLDYKQPDPIEVYLDEGKMRQVVMNFIDNAIYYTPDGEVKVELVHTPSAVELRVVDNGIGVPKDSQGQLFTKFYRAGNAIKVRPDGTGLGLYMAKMVVEAQEGKIIFSSTEGKGSTFGFSFPFSKIEAKAANRQEAKATPRAR